MSAIIHLDHKDMPEEARRLFRLAFPSYNGRKFKLLGVDGPISVRSYWSGGSRDYYVFVRADGETLSAPTSSWFDNVTGVDSVTIPDGCAVVQHSIFCGKDTGLTLIVPQDRIALFQPPAVGLTETERHVLGITSCLKPFARRETAAMKGINGYEWEETVKVLAARGLLRKNGSITPAGRNAVQDYRPR